MIWTIVVPLHSDKFSELYLTDHFSKSLKKNEIQYPNLSAAQPSMFCKLNRRERKKESLLTVSKGFCRCILWFYAVLRSCSSCTDTDNVISEYQQPVKNNTVPWRIQVHISVTGSVECSPEEDPVAFDYSVCFLARYVSPFHPYCGRPVSFGFDIARACVGTLSRKLECLKEKTQRTESFVGAFLVIRKVEKSCFHL